ncbi:MAG: fibronectin type III domain-containing protein, partial [Bacteroidales bacterium]|nr:fibronectin type III domain-containing protein [Bacteroidales bacterium]
MRRYLLRMLLLAALIVPWTTQAENVVIGDTTSTTTYYYLPVSMYFNYSMTQQIYTAQELGDMGGVINSISFKYAYSSSFSMTGVQLYMKNVTRTNFSSTTDYEAVTSADLVWTGTFAATGAGWVTITLPEPFVYDGTSNLLVCMYDPTSGYPGSSYKFTTSTTTGNMALDYYSDSYSPDLANLGSYSGSKYVRTYRNVVKIDLEPDGCSYPQNIALTSNSINGAVFHWGTSRTHLEQGYQYVVVPAGSDPDWTNPGTTTDTLDIAVSGLAPNTAYDLYVRSNCGTELSRGKKFSFRTACAAMSVSDLPYNCNFDDAPAGSANSSTDPNFMFCWNRILDPSIAAASRAYPYIIGDASYAHSGNNSIVFQVSPTAPAVQVAILPAMGSDPAALRLSFYARCTSPTIPDTLVIGVMNDASSISSFMPVDTVAITGNTYDRYFVSLAPYAGNWQTHNGSLVAMRVYRPASAANGGNLYIDDVTLELQPTCLEPGQLVVNEYEHNSATLAWNANGDETMWTIRYRLTDTNIWQYADATTNPFTVTGLEPNSEYEFQVAARCGSDTSGYSTAATVTTICTPINLAENGTFSYDFNTAEYSGTSNYIECWYRFTSNDGSYQYYPYQNASNGRSGGCLYFYPYNSSYYPSVQMAIMPKVADDMARVRLTFYARTTVANNKLTVGVMSDPHDTSTYVVVDTIKPSTSYGRYIVDFDNYNGNGKFIAFRVLRSENSGGYFYIDDVSLRLRSTCPTPTNFVAEGSAATPLDGMLSMTWDAVEGAQNYWVRIWNAADIDVDDIDNYSTHAPIVTVATANTSFNFATGSYTDIHDEQPITVDVDVLHNSEYYVSVRANCDNDNAGDWAEPVLVKTPYVCDEGYELLDAAIGNGTTTLSNTLVYSGYGNSYSQVLFTAEELQNMDLTAGKITAIQLEFAAATYNKILVLFMGNTTDTTISADDMVPVANMTRVYNSGEAILPAAGWQEFKFQTTFVWDGVSNVVLAAVMDEPTGGGHTGTAGWQLKGYSATGMAGTWYKDGTMIFDTVSPSASSATLSVSPSYRPNIKFTSCSLIPDCYKVTSVTATPDSTYPTQVNLTWTIDDRETRNPQFFIYYALDTVTGDPTVDPGFNNATPMMPVTGTSFIVEGLEPNHNYRFYIQALCENNGLSKIVATDVVRTACAPYEWPYTMGFETGTADEVDPAYSQANFGVYCWDRLANVNMPYINTTAHTGTKSLRWGAVADTNYALAVMPVMNEDEITLDMAQLVFWARANSANDTAWLYLYYTTNVDTITDATLFDSVMVTGNTYKEYNYRFSNADIALEGGERLALGAKKTLYIDDIILREDPGVLKPTSFWYVANSVTQTTASFAWVDTDNQPHASQYEIGFVAGDEWNADDEDMIIDEVIREENNDNDTIFYTTGSLEENNRYFAAVRAVDPIEGKVSEWTAPVGVIVTKCGLIYDMPWTENFDDPNHVHRTVYTSSLSTSSRPTAGTYGLTNSDVNCWAFTAPASTKMSYVANNATYARENGANYLVMHTSSATNVTLAVLPEFDMAVEQLRIMFWYRNYSATSSNKELELGYITNVDSIAETFHVIATFPVTTSYEFVDYVFNQDEVTVPTEGVRLAFRSKYYPVMIDDVVVDEAPACQYPALFAAGTTTAYTIPLRWVNSEIGAPNQWYIEYTHDSITQIDTVIYDVDQMTILPGRIISSDTVYNQDSTEFNVVNVSDPDTMTHVLVNLEPFTTYSIRIKSDCGDFISDFSQPLTPRTLNDQTDIVAARLTSPAIQVDQAVIDTVNHTVNITVDFGTPDEVFDALKFNLTASTNATGIYVGTQSFSSSRNYAVSGEGLVVTVKAEDATITQDWTIYVESETCTYPRDINFTDVQRRTVTANWTILDSLISQFDIYIDTLEHSDSELDQLFTTITGTSHTFTGLYREHIYNFYVRAHCSDGNLSAWKHATVETPGMPCDPDAPAFMTIGDSTSSSSTSYFAGYPFYNYSASQMLITAEELRNNPNTFNSIWYYVTSPVSDEMPIQIYMGHTSLTALSTSNYATAADLQLVATYNDIAFDEEGWYEILFDTPFEYDGTSNLVVAIYNSIGDYISPYPYVKASTTTGNKFIYRYNDDEEGYATVTNTTWEYTSSSRPVVRLKDCIPANPCPAPDTLWVVKDPDNSRQVELHWSAQGDYAAEFPYLLSMDSTETPESSSNVQTVYDSSYINLINLEPNTTYYVNLKAVCVEINQITGDTIHNDSVSAWRQLTFVTNSDCRIPENAAVTLVDKRQAQLTFTMDEFQDHNYRYIVSTNVMSNEQLDAATPTATGIDTGSVLINLAEYGTIYYIYLGNDCGGNDGVSPYTLAGSVLTADECPAPTNLRFSEVDMTGAVASWKRGQFGEETEWTISWTDGQTPHSATVTDTFYVIPALHPNTEYTVNVRANCGANSNSVNLTKTFTTKPYTPCTTVGTGTSTSSTLGMVTNYRNATTEYIYTASEIGQGGMLNSIAFNVSAAATGSYASGTIQYKYYVGTTTQSQFGTWVPATDLTLVATRNTHYEAGVNTIEFDAPFNYNGTDNLVVVFTQQAQEWSGSPSIVYTTVSSSGFKQQSDDDVQYANPAYAGTRSVISTRPNLDFCFASEFTGCQPISHLAMDTVGTTMAHASWYYGNDESAWQWVNVAITSADVLNGLTDSLLNTMTQTVQTNSLELTGLQPDLTYLLFVRPACADTVVPWRYVQYTTAISCYAPNAVEAWRNDTVEDIDYRHIALIARHTDSVNNNLDLENFVYQVWPYTGAQVGDTVEFTGGDSVVIGSERMRPGYFMAWRVRGVCQPGDSSRWVQHYASIFDSLTIPYYENFNQNNTVSRMLWNQSFSDIDDSVTSYPQIANSSSYTIRFHSGTSSSRISHEQYAVGPIMKDPVNTMMLSFYAWHNSSTVASTKTMILGYTVDDSTFVPFDTLNVTATAQASANFFEYYLDELPVEAHRIIFKWVNTANTTSQYSYIDDLTLQALPACRKPIDFALVNNDNAYSATLSWSTANNEQNWLLRYQAARDTVMTDLNITAEDATLENGVYTYVFANLQPATPYVATLYSLCGEDTSAMANNTVRFTTKADSATFATFGIAQPANTMIGNPVIDRAQHTILVDLLAGTPLTAVKPTFTLNPAEGSYVTVFGQTIQSGVTAFDFTDPQQFTLHAPAADVAPVNWIVSVDEEACPTITNLTVVDKGRSFAEIEWQVGQSHHMTAPQTQFLMQLAINDFIVRTDTIVVTGDSTLRHYRIEGLHRSTEYNVKLRSLCKQNWAQTIEFKTEDMPCGDGSFDITIGDGTYNSGYAFTNGGWGNSYAQTLFTAEELLAAGVNPGPITALELNHHIGTSSPYAKLFLLFMGTTDNTTLTATTMVPQMTKVYSSGTAITPTEGWHRYEFSTPFVWDGVSNLVLGAVVDEPEGGGHTGYNYWYFTATAATNKTVARYADGSMMFDTINPSPTQNSATTYNYRPNVKFTGCIPVTICDAPANATVQLTGEGTNSAVISWQRPDNDNDSIYRAAIRRATDSIDYSTITEFDYVGTELSFSVDTLQPFTEYVVYLSSLCGGADTAATTIWVEVPFRTQSTCRVPTDFTAELTYKNEVTLTWVADIVQDNNFSLLVSTEPVEDFDAIDEFTVTGLDTNVYVADSLEYNTTYYFYIANVCDGAPSPFIEATATTIVECPAPVNLTASNLSTTSATLTWERGYMGDETQWEVTLFNDDDTVISFITDTNRAVVTSLYDGTEYTALVRALCTGISEADTVDFMTPFFSACNTIGNGTSGAAYPFCYWYNFGYTQYLFTPEEVGNVGSINKIAFEINNNTLLRAKKTRIFIGTTTATTLASAFVDQSALQEVYTAKCTSIPAMTGWYEIELDNNFEYDGESNLVVAVYTDTTGGCREGYGSNSIFLYTTKTGGARYQQVDAMPSAGMNSYGMYLPSATGTSTTYRANMQFCFDVQPVECGNAVTNLQLDAATETTATISWYSGARETQWKYFVYNVTDDTMAVDTAVANQANLTITGLQANRDYVFHITPVCANGTEAWNTLNFSTVYNCFAPVTAVATVNHELGIATLKVVPDTNSTAAQFEYQYRIAGTNEYISVLGGDSIYLTNLEGFVNYEWRVRSICGETEHSRWTNGNNFLYQGIIELPYTEGFEDAAGSWNYWTSERIAGTGTAGYSRNSTATFVHEGTYSYKLGDQSSGTVTTWTSPRINVPTANNYMFTIWIYRSNYSTLKPNEGIRFWTSDDETLDSTDNELMYVRRQYTVEPVVSEIGWYKYSAIIPTAGVQHVIFEGISEYGAATYFDDINIREVSDSDYATIVLLSDSLGTVHGDTTVFLGSTVTISATPIEHYQFIMWSDSNTANPRNITLMHNDTLSAVFAPATYTVSTQTIAGRGRVQGTGEYTYLDTVTLNAIGSTGYEFYFWNGDSSLTTNPISFVATADTTLTVTFGTARYAVTGVANIDTIEFIGAGRYYFGDTVSITAPEVYGFTFMGWNDDPDDTMGITRTVVVEAHDTAFYATYDTADFVLTLNANDDAMGTVTGAGTYKYMREVTITAIPNEGNFFSQWSDGVTTATRTVTVDGN